MMIIIHRRCRRNYPPVCEKNGLQCVRQELINWRATDDRLLIVDRKGGQVADKATGNHPQPEFHAGSRIR